MAVLLSRAIDPFLGIFTGVFAYYLYENNPRTAPADHDRLVELVRWKQEKTRLEEEKRLKNDEASLENEASGGTQA